MSDKKVATTARNEHREALKKFSHPDQLTCRIIIYLSDYQNHRQILLSDQCETIQNFIAYKEI